MARPTNYTPEIIKEICDKLCDGIPLEEICRQDGMPSAQTIHSWKSRNKPESVPDSVPEDIAHAREIGYDTIASRLRETARGRGDTTYDVQRDKLIIETDLKLLAKWTKKYSDKSQIEHSGAVTLATLVESSYKKLEEK